MKPRAAWTAYAACAALTVAAASAVLWRNAESERERLREEALRRRLDLATGVLWRLESALLPLFVREASRPPDDYFAFTGSVGEEGVLARSRPSPLLGRFAPYTLLHFRVETDGTIHSPQDPKGALRDRALALGIPLVALDRAAARRRLLEREVGGHRLLRAIVEREEGEASERDDDLAPETSSYLERVAHFRVRRRSFRDAYAAMADARGDAGAAGRLEPYVIAGRLFLLRHLVHRGHPSVQGCWLDVDALCRRLGAEAAQALPGSRVVFAKDSAASRREGETLRRLPLASLPLELWIEPPPAPRPPSSFLVTSGAALVALLVALGSIAALLRVTLREQERRTAFVRAVTHELRTPLTSLRMSADLLADGLGGPEQRRRALASLWRESLRLEHLVENVLAYSRIEALGRRGVSRFRLSAGELLDRALERAREVCERKGFDLAIEAAPAVRAAAVRADPSAVDRILFNLVDNATKYGRAPVRVEARLERGRLAIAVEDAGEGVDPAVRRRLFRPFVKSDRDSARSAPGTGLGLALCRELARTMGGDLAYAGGSRFVLELPLEAGAGGEESGAL